MRTLLRRASSDSSILLRNMYNIFSLASRFRYAMRIDGGIIPLLDERVCARRKTRFEPQVYRAVTYFILYIFKSEGTALRRPASVIIAFRRSFGEYRIPRGSLARNQGIKDEHFEGIKMHWDAYKRRVSFYFLFYLKCYFRQTFPIFV